MALPILDDNLDLALGRMPGQKTDTSKKEIEKLGKAIMEKASSSIQAATKAIVPDVPKMIAQLTTEIEKGPIEGFTRSVKRLERLVDSLGIDLRDYNEELANFLVKREETGQKSDQIIQKLREQNIIAEKNALNEVHILNKEEIKQRQVELKSKQEAIVRVEKGIQDMQNKLQKKGNLDEKEEKNLKERIQAQTINLNLLKERNEELSQSLNPQGEEGQPGRRPLPRFFETIKDAFLGPFQAVGESFNMMKDSVSGVVEVFSFLSPKGALGKTMEGFSKLGVAIKGITGIFTAARLLLAAKILAIVGAFAFVTSKIDEIANVIQTIGTKIGNVISEVVTDIKDLFKTAANAVIKLLNKIPGVNIDLLETSSMKEESEKKEQEKGIKNGDLQSVGDTGITTESGFEDDGKFLKPKYLQPQFSDDAGMNGNTSNIVYDKESGKSMLLNRQVVGDRFKGFGGGTSEDASVAETVAKLSKQKGASDTGSPIVINNAPTTVTSQKSGTTVSGYVDNRPDESFMYTRYGGRTSTDF